jgi:chromosome segregation ATPase
MATTALTAAAPDFAVTYDHLLYAVDRLAMAKAAEIDKRAAILDKLLADVITATFDMQGVPNRLKNWQTEDQQIAERLDAFTKMQELLNMQRTRLETNYGPQVVGVLIVRRQALQNKLAHDEEATDELEVQIEALTKRIDTITSSIPGGKKAAAEEKKTKGAVAKK